LLKRRRIAVQVWKSFGFRLNKHEMPCGWQQGTGRRMQKDQQGMLVSDSCICIASELS
jgi:hypothetical protein